jgi:choline dehydrogenase-like flavoprotein
LFDHIIVGSGAGGATIAKELACAGKKVLVLESGPKIRADLANRTYSIAPSAVEIWSTLCQGGTTMVTMANAVRSDNYALAECYKEAEGELGVSAVPDSHIGKATGRLQECSDKWQRMPKAIDFNKCIRCGRCAVGCPNGAKWDATKYLEEAERNGAKVLASTEVRKVILEKNAVRGVETSGGKRFEADSIILCAGALETPRILLRSGIEGVGDGLYVDTFVDVGGVVRNIGQNSELSMALVMKGKGYLLSPHYSSFLNPYFSSKGIMVKPSDMLSLMIKIEDEPTGKVTLDNVFKTLTERDKRLIDLGKENAEEILIKAGVEEDTIVTTFYRGTHPGGTCSKIVKSYETEISGLRISDASIIPGPFGLPPMLTIIAVAKKISATMLGKN